jgi:hypothetical protein
MWTKGQRGVNGLSAQCCEAARELLKVQGFPQMENRSHTRENHAGKMCRVPVTKDYTQKRT